MRALAPIGLLIAALAVPGIADAGPVRATARGVAVGTAAVGRTAVTGTAVVGRTAARGTAAVARTGARGVACVATLFHRCGRRY